MVALPPLSLLLRLLSVLSKRKKGGADAGKEEDAEPAMEKGCVIAVENIGADCSREDLKVGVA